jgi:tetratricopeptide (TPR) repeat protein
LTIEEMDPLVLAMLSVKRVLETGSASDWSLAVNSCETALGNTTVRGPARAILLFNLGRAFFYRFRALEIMNDLDAAINALNEAIQLIPNEEDSLADSQCILASTDPSIADDRVYR